MYRGDCSMKRWYYLVSENHTCMFFWARKDLLIALASPRQSIFQIRLVAHRTSHIGSLFVRNVQRGNESGPPQKCALHHYHDIHVLIKNESLHHVRTVGSLIVARCPAISHAYTAWLPLSVWFNDGTISISHKGQKVLSKSCWAMTTTKNTWENASRRINNDAIRETICLVCFVSPTVEASRVASN